MREVTMKKHPELCILVAGDFMIDRYLYSNVSRISPEAPVPIARVQHIEDRVGGAGNVSLNIMALGSRVKILSCIGRDAPGEELLDRLKTSGADVAHIYQDPARKTGVKTRIVAQNQQILRYDEEQIADIGEAFLRFVKRNLNAVFLNVQGLVLSDYGKGVLTAELSQLLIRTAKQAGIPVFVDPKGADYSKYSGANICTPNLKELAEASGQSHLLTEEEIRRSAFAICERFHIDDILVTRSEKGMSLISGATGEKSDFPAVVQEVCDVTGAGDTVVSAFAICMTAGSSLQDCCRLANTAASVVVSKFGAATASVEEVNAALQSLHHEKICQQEQAAQYARQLQRSGKKVVFTNGCFDLVHAGHIASFRRARSFGDVLIVGVNSDSSIRRLKGPGRPIVSLENRLKLLEALEMVDYIVPFDEDTPQALIQAIRPDVLVKGKDWEGKTVAGADLLATYGGSVQFIDLEQGLSTTAIVERIRASRF